MSHGEGRERNGGGLTEVELSVFAFAGEEAGEAAEFFGPDHYVVLVLVVSVVTE